MSSKITGPLFMIRASIYPKKPQKKTKDSKGQT